MYKQSPGRKQISFELPLIRDMTCLNVFVVNLFTFFISNCDVAFQNGTDIYYWYQWVESLQCPYGGQLNVPLISSDKSCSSTSGNKTEKKTLKEIMESCQDLDILIVVCTIVCVLQILCLCLLRKTRNIPSSRLYGDTQDLIRKPARILNGKKMDSVQWQISRNNPSNMANNHFRSYWQRQTRR